MGRTSLHVDVTLTADSDIHVGGLEGNQHGRLIVGDIVTGALVTLYLGRTAEDVVVNVNRLIGGLLAVREHEAKVADFATARQRAEAGTVVVEGQELCGCISPVCPKAHAGDQVALA